MAENMSENEILNSQNDVNGSDDVKADEAVTTPDANDKKKKILKELFSWIKIVVIAVVIAFIITNVFIINANVPSGSMENTIMTKSRMIGLRTSYWFDKPDRGEIVIFKFPDDESQEFVKRVIGLPGEKVTIKDAKIYINDSEKPLEEPYLKEDWIINNGDDEPMVFNVPKNSYFVMGDNRNNSNDARSWQHHYVKEDKIDAKAALIYWPIGRFKTLKTAEYSYDKEQNKKK